MFVRVGSMRHHQLASLSTNNAAARGRHDRSLAKYLLLVLFALGGLAAWADSEAVLPAYLEDALDLAALARARLFVVSVARPPEPPTEVETQAAIELETHVPRRVFTHATCSMLVVRAR
jgi:hypothetical protein